ncbi:hypothetical protein AHAS_Ahas04G0152400 [Arachis hypogaea]
MTLALFLKVHPPTLRGFTNPTKMDNWFHAMVRALQASMFRTTNLLSLWHINC